MSKENGQSSAPQTPQSGTIQNTARAAAPPPPPQKTEHQPVKVMTPEEEKSQRDALALNAANGAVSSGSYALAVDILQSNGLNVCFFCQTREPEPLCQQLVGEVHGNKMIGSMCRPCWNSTRTSTGFQQTLHRALLDMANGK